MKIAILGYGKMGREVEQLALSQDHDVIVTFDNEKDWKVKGNLLKKADVAVEFSMPESAIVNIKRCFEANTPVVVGTTGWHGDIVEVAALCRQSGQAMFISPNFNIAMNIFMELNRKLASLMDRHPQYDILIEEIHHIHKKDKPSGTAIQLAKDIIAMINRKSDWVTRPSIKPDELEIISIREGETPGTHTIRYDCENDLIMVKHIAKNRKGFAEGALMAAGWLIGKKGVFGMNDLLGI